MQAISETALPGSASDLIEVRIRRMGWEAESVLSLELGATDGSELPRFEPGAHVDLHLDDGTLRQYSLCGDPLNRRSYRVAVREIAAGRASRQIHRSLRPGAVLRISRPRNNFAFEAASRYLFIAGGIGITPLLPMMRAASMAGAPWSLLYCIRDPDQAAFLDEARALGGEVLVHASGNGTRLDVVSRLAVIEPDTLIYCCGPERLMTSVEQASRHWPEGTVRFEWFAPRSRPEDEISGSFRVVCARSGLALEVMPEQSILQALTAAGVEIPSSCEQGVCGTCEVRVLEGEVDHRDSILSTAERASHQMMMACVSRSRGGTLVLDL